MFAIGSYVTIPVVLAQVAGSGGISLTTLGGHLLAVVVYSLVGIVVLGGSFWTIKRLMPYSVTKEIEEDQNTALAIIIGSVIIGMSIIIAASILG